MPIRPHTVSQLHPQIGLFLRRQSLPTLLNARKGRLRNGVFRGSANLLGDLLLGGTEADGSHQWRRGSSAVGAHGCYAAAGSSLGDGAKEHDCCRGKENVRKRFPREGAGLVPVNWVNSTGSRDKRVENGATGLMTALN